MEQSVLEAVLCNARAGMGAQADAGSEGRWAAWACWSTERRRQALVVHDGQLADALHGILHALWKAEFQARGAGRESNFAPFSAPLFPLLASMEFDGTTDSKGRYLMHSVGWPASVCEDPKRIPAALAAARRGAWEPRQVPPRRWVCELLSPPPQSWPEFEERLALVVEQLLVRAGAVEVPAAAAAPPEAAEAELVLTGRSAKRQRQRERRKESRRLAGGGGGGHEVSDAVEQASTLGSCVEESGADAPPVEPVPQPEQPQLEQPKRLPLTDVLDTLDEDSEEEHIDSRRQFTEPVPANRRLLYMTPPDDVDRVLRALWKGGPEAEERCRPTAVDDASSIFSVSTSAGSSHWGSSKAASSMPLSSHAAAPAACSASPAAPALAGSTGSRAAAAETTQATEARANDEASAPVSSETCRLSDAGAPSQPPCEQAGTPGAAQRAAAREERTHSPGCGEALHRNASFSLMDGIRMQLESAMAALQAGRQEGCETRLKSAIELCSGLEPYLQSVNRPMSQHWDKLQQATQQVDWREMYLQQETRDLFHKGMSASPVIVQTLQFLCRTLRATRTLQIGLFTGGAALGIAESLPADGCVVALEADGFLADFARSHLHQSAHGRKVMVRHGDIGDLLRELPASEEGDKFQVIFIDGSKSEYGAYLDAILERDLLAPGGVFVVDDVLWKGAVYSSSALGDRDHRCSCNCCWPSPWPSKLPEEEVASVVSSFNAHVRRDDRLEPLVLPIHNGVALIRRASGDHPPADSEGTLQRPSGARAPSCEGSGGARAAAGHRPCRGVGTRPQLASASVGATSAVACAAGHPTPSDLWPSTPEMYPTPDAAGPCQRVPPMEL